MNNIKLSSIISATSKQLKAEDTILQALTQMHSQSISSVVILDNNNRPIGIFTEQDALEVIAKKTNTNNNLSSFIKKHLYCTHKDTYIHDAYIYIENHSYRHVIVIDDDGQYLGVATEGDFLRHTSYEEIAKFTSIQESMSESILSIESTTTIAQTAILMNQQKYDYAIILDDFYPIGIIKERDIAHYYSTNGELADKKVSEIKQENICLIKQSTSLQEASELMKSHGVHQLIVVDSHKKLIGLITRHDVLKAIHGSYFEFLVKTIESKNSNEEILKNHKQELENKTIFLNSIVDTIPDLVWLKDTDGKYLLCNSMFEKFFGAKKEDIIGKTDFDFVDKELAQFFKDHDKKVLVEDHSKVNEEYLVFADGSHEGLYDTVKTSMKDSNGKTLGVLGIAHDVSDRIAREKELEKLANYDSLTNLPNRSFLKVYLKKSLAKALRNGSSLALIILDLDRFKDINDSYGHTIGDELLSTIAKKLLERLRDGDLVARLGGDEFAIILEEINHVDDIARIVKDILRSISTPCKLSNSIEVHIESSAGIVIAPKDGSSVEELLQHADSALYQAKNDGRALYRYYTDEMTKSAKKRILCENRLRNALENKELELYYQPQVHIQTGRIVGAEALLRWNEPTEGLISPNRFIPIAEETGLINSIGEFVLNEACKQGKAWIDSGHRISIAVNVSANQVKYQDLPMVVGKALEMSGFSADRLELEITESAVMQREEQAVAMLHALRAKGIRLAIDDFGTGYSSLSYLKRFPIDVLKIDKSFIDDIPYAQDDMAIVVAIIEMGKALGYQVLAEGTEHKEQIDFLKEKGCTLYQGYFKSKPVPASEFVKLLEAQDS